MSRRAKAMHLVALLCMSISVVQAQDVGDYGKAPAMSRQGLPDALREVGFDQNLGGTLPLDARFRNEEGESVALGSFFGEKPVISGGRKPIGPRSTSRRANRWSAVVAQRRAEVPVKCVTRSVDSAVPDA